MFDLTVERRLTKPGTPFTSITISGELKGEAGKLGRFKLGSFSQKDLRIERVKPSALGLRFLSRFRMTFDFPRKTVYLAKGARYADPEPSATSGMSLSRINDMTVVHSVMKDGPAELAGLKPKDILKQIDGKDVSTVDFFSLRKLLTSEVGKKVSITVLRANRSIDLQLILREN